MTRFIVAAAFTFAFSLSPLAVFGTSSALPLLSLEENEDVSDDTSSTEPPLELQLSSGVPQSTTPTTLKQQGAKLTWTPTGTAGIQDTYEVIVTDDLAEDSEQAPEQRLSGTDLTVAEFDVSSLAEGAYRWQVRSCTADSVCSGWSQPATFTLDGTAPGKPIAGVTSGQYDMVVRFTGSTEASSKVVVTVNDRTCVASADTIGVWTCEFDTSFAYGDYEASIVASDKVGNTSEASLVLFAVKELFVAQPITVKELPETLEIVPVDTKAENEVFKQPVAVVDIVNKGIAEASQKADTPGVTAVIPAITTDGGIVKASESGWQLIGLPWFVWLAGIGSVLAGWRAIGGPMPRQLESLLSLQ